MSFPYVRDAYESIVSGLCVPNVIYRLYFFVYLSYISLF